MYAANAFGFWAKHAPAFLADERVKSASPLLKGKQAGPALPRRSAWSASSARGTTR